jgi:outer membrane receptor protein involved in Fe transport
MLSILQNDFQLHPKALFKTSLFLDWGSFGYWNPDTQDQFKSYSQQWGVQTAFLWDQWKWGLSARQVYFRQVSSYQNVDTPDQTVGNVQISKIFRGRVLSFEPTLQGVSVTGYGLLPQGSLGVRHEWAQGESAVFSRFSYSNRIPSLLDRYARASDFTGNPHLLKETDWTGQIGFENQEKGRETSVQAYAQWKQDARVFNTATVTNMDQAYILALTGTHQVSLARFLDQTTSLSLSQSKILLNASEFPYVPGLLGLAGLNFHHPGDDRSWESTWVARFSSSQSMSASSSQLAAGYIVVDAGLQLHLNRHLSVTARMENIFDRSIEIFPGYPQGRVATFLLFGEI